ncbi:hypothetical protein Tco_0019419 [Tanacetum coccineum]
MFSSGPQDRSNGGLTAERERERGRRGEMMTMVMLGRLWCGGDEGSDGVGVVGDDVGVIVWWWWRGRCGDAAEKAVGGGGKRGERERERAAWGDDDNGDVGGGCGVEVMMAAMVWVVPAVVGDDVGVIVWWWWRGRCGDAAETAGGGRGKGAWRRVLLGIG